ncbi:hypothetical protein P3S67_019263 [Capsicum chacoense]
MGNIKFWLWVIFMVAMANQWQRITGSGTAHPDRCWDEERSALLELQANMMSSNGGHLGLWETYNEIGYSDCCSWYWVKCNLTTDRVVELDLREARLGSGVGWSFNATLFLPFKSLQVLLLSENFVAGWNKNEGFDKLSQLTNLKVLVLGLNYLPFPNVLSPLCWISSLEVLILASGQMGSIGFHSLKNYTMPTDEGITEKCPGLRYLRALVLTGYGINDISLLSALGLGTDTGLSNLEKLDLTSNGFNSTIFSSLKHFPSLKHLDLKNNDIVGNIEMSDIIALSNLNLRMNNFESFVTTKSDLSASATAYGKVNSNSKFLYLSTITNVARTLKKSLRNMSTLEYLNLDGSYLNENFLSSIGQMTSLKVLNMAFGGNYGILPNQGWCELQNIQELSFMNNNFEGTLPSCLGNLTSLRWLSHEGNRFTGNIASGGDSHHSSTWIFDLTDLNLKFFAIEGCVNRQKLPSFLHYQHDLIILAIDHNQLPGNFPTWLLENNTRLAGLYARDNAFIGPLKLPSSRHLYLEQLDVSNNELSGRVPANISSAFPNLNILNMSLNLFEGPIPSDIGGFHLLALDLSHNFLSGGVPRDLAIEIALRDRYPVTFFSNPLLHLMLAAIISLERFLVDGCGNTDPVYDKEKTLTYKGSILKYMTGNDLSSNRLAGDIPIELGNLSKIHALNLSHNHFVRRIPGTFSNLHDIESLDLSYNSLNGRIPVGLLELYSLAIFSVAYNNLSGAVPPSKAQFSTFDKRSYEGNPLLCAYPLDNECSSTKSSDTSNDGSGDSTGFVDTESFYIRYLINNQNF